MRLALLLLLVANIALLVWNVSAGNTPMATINGVGVGACFVGLANT